jgi:hypothetical protein
MTSYRFFKHIGSSSKVSPQSHLGAEKSKKDDQSEITINHSKGVPFAKDSSRSMLNVSPPVKKKIS